MEKMNMRSTENYKKLIPEIITSFLHVAIYSLFFSSHLL